MERFATRGARARLMAEVGEISEMALAMAAASVGLRGGEARKAQRQAASALKSERWTAICEAASKAQERIILRDIAQVEARTAKLLSSKDI